MRARVYLAGAMWGRHPDEVHDWRRRAAEWLTAAEIDYFDPANPDANAAWLGREQDPAVAAEIVERDFAWIAASSALLVNVTHPSWGTAMEIQEAAARGILVVAFDEATGGRRISPWVRHHADAVHGSMIEALHDLYDRVEDLGLLVGQGSE